MVFFILRMNFQFDKLSRIENTLKSHSYFIINKILEHLARIFIILRVCINSKNTLEREKNMKYFSKLSFYTYVQSKYKITQTL